MTVSIIIAVKTWQKNLEECVGKCLGLDYPDFEILILPDNPFAQELLPKSPIPIRIIPTGGVSPAHKRDISLKSAQGEILAFLDDDAYPEKNWLKNAIAYFKDGAVAAVGGPAITPGTDNFRQKASGAVYASILVSGKYVYRYLPGPKQTVEDFPSCNFLVRKPIMQQLGGFNTNFWPGEDTKLCLDIVHNLGKKIIYGPDVLVYHHRRELFKPHLRQIANYALHRGYFVKRFPQTSLKFAYFIPTFFLFGVILGALISIWQGYFRVFYFLGLTLYLTLALISSAQKQLRLIPYVFLGIIMTHFTYGIYFLKGLFSNKLKEES